MTEVEKILKLSSVVVNGFVSNDPYGRVYKESNELYRRLYPAHFSYLDTYLPASSLSTLSWILYAIFSLPGERRICHMQSIIRSTTTYSQMSATMRESRKSSRLHLL